MHKKLIPDNTNLILVNSLKYSQCIQKTLGKKYFVRLWKIQKKKKLTFFGDYLEKQKGLGTGYQSLFRLTNVLRSFFSDQARGYF